MAAVQGIITNGTRGIIADIECRLSNNLPTIIIVGSASRTVGESKERIRGAFATSRIMLPRKRITVNLAPADIPKGDSGFDLPIAVAILAASQRLVLPPDRRQAFIGELGLDGSIRGVRGIIGKLLAGRASGIDTFFIPMPNLEQAKLVPGVRLIPVPDLSWLYRYLTGSAEYAALATGRGNLPAGLISPQGGAEVLLSEIAGQAQAKRALEIAAAGGHNIFFEGPPGTGKSMLAKALIGLLPPLNQEEILEVTQLHSLASPEYERLVTRRPFRTPHHSASLAAITGGGLQLRPGELSLAHRGVLFFDELPEFSRETLEALRQPLENKVISVIRAHGSAEYPATFIFVATANPCPCGYYGSDAGPCDCLPAQISAYRSRLSGPILDRIDLCSHVHEVEHARLLVQPVNPEADASARGRVLRARLIQMKRFDGSTTLNADMANAEIRRLARINPAALTILNKAASHLRLSARGYMRTIKVARTIADLEASAEVTGTHLAEALGYRPAPAGRVDGGRRKALA